MDPLDFLDSQELLQFFHCNKTELSCMENPNTFLNQLRDHNLVPEDRYQKVIRKKSRENQRRAIYDILDWMETEHCQHIHSFWRCVFKDVTLNQYPTLKHLRNSLMDGSYRSQLPENEENEEEKEEKEEEQKETKSVKKRRKSRRRHLCTDEEEQPGPSSQLSPGQRRRPKKLHFSSPVKKGQREDIWTWPLYRSQFPVECGNLRGALHRRRLAEGQRCILVQNQWLSPSEFEKAAGKQSYKNWKLSIRCRGTPLMKLLQDGHLQSVGYKRGGPKARTSLFASAHLTSDEDEEEEEQRPQSRQQVWKVSCGSAAGTLHQRRFASGSRGKSIRTETAWLSPEEFTEEALDRRDNWKEDIECEGKPLRVLIEDILQVHSELCHCSLCKLDDSDLEAQRNDDQCCICRSGGEDQDQDQDQEDQVLVVCDDCPRSFHQRCHLPHVEDDLLREDSPWLCTFCVFRTNQDLFLELDGAVTSHQISKHMLQCQYLLLSLCCADEDQSFATDPRLCWEDYSRSIQTPMWWSNIADKLQRNRYLTVGQFVSDVQLIFTNSASYNQNNAVNLAKGERLKKIFDEEFVKVFKVCDV
ncbi:nuclear body protein SP140 isoform X2 [Mugil cephalus]|uniref:nuclear body protein SP140 isoform X2 n=1 Tax=Mugil cephalus TaxID=48193 RepID=UPI001FB6DCF7|nr:nuclear body protein SP140 isoform X2 [Mugil cephalus]